jgi:tetratricopeptide (TPR) repeat protein
MKRPRAKVKDRARPVPLAPEDLGPALREAAEHRVALSYDAAIARYLEIERRNPEHPDATYFLALIDLARDRPAEALPRLQTLVRRLPKAANVWQALAFAQEQLGLWSDALSSLQTIAQLDPDRSPTELALALETLGRIHEAAQIYRGLAARDETRVAGLVGLASLHPKELSADQLTDLRRAAVEASLASGAPAFSALGRALEARDAYDAAFGAFAEANRLKRQTLTGELPQPEKPVIGPPVRESHPDDIARENAAAIRFMKSVFTADFIRAHEGRGHHVAAPIFVVGMPRSGSTLIEQILSSHRQVQGLGESGALGGVLRDRYPDDLFAPNPPGHFRDLAQAYLQAQHARGWVSAPRFVDKTLGNYMSIGMIHLMFPKAVILHSVRDAVETCLGCFRQMFATGNEETYDLGDIGRLYVRYREVMAHWASVLPNRVIDVSHEALVTAPEERIRWLVTEACGLVWDPACLRFHETRRAVRTASVAQVRQPIFTTSLARWRRYEKHLRPLLEVLGPYAPARTARTSR